MIVNPCHECGAELDKDTAILDVERNGRIVIVCPNCFWEEA